MRGAAAPQHASELLGCGRESTRAGGCWKRGSHAALGLLTGSNFWYFPPSRHPAPANKLGAPTDSGPSGSFSRHGGNPLRPSVGWRPETICRALLASVAAAALAAGVAAPSASAATIAVTNLNDSGPGSLRQAILEAAPNETITVPAGQIVLTSGALAIAKSLTISGSGATVISGNDVSRVFTITAAPTVTLSGLTITHGKDPFGAGINAAGGTLTLQSVTVSHNRAGGGGTDGSGGGIEFTGAGTLSLIDSAVSENSAGGGALAAGFGGGIEYQPTGNAQAFSLSLTRSQVAANHAGGGGTESSGFGGGIGASSGFESGSIAIALTDSVLSGNVAGGAGTEASGFGGGLELSSGGAKNTLMLTLERTSVTGNTAGGGGAEASGFGGGVDFSSGGAAVVQTLTAADSTIAGNSAGGGGAKADGFGGGIEFGTGTATLSHLTVAGNSAGGGGGNSFGGGLAVGSVGTGAISNSIVAGNPGANCFTAIPSGGHNIDDGSTCGFKGSADKSGVDPKLGALGGHPGPSLTQMPLAGSPAIDSADPATCPAIDQRGVTRPQGAGCDIGAVEVPPPVATTSSVSSATSEAATVGGTVNPNFSATTYHFDFGTTTAYGNFTVAASAGEGGLAGAVAAALSKLKPATLYHFRLVASNAAGTVVGNDQTLTTRPARKPPSAKPPRITGARLTNKRFRVGRKRTAISARRAPVGTSFRFTLSAPAKVQVTITRSATGLRRGHTCVAPTSKLRRAHAKRCTRTITVGTLTRAKLRAAADAIPFSGRIGTRALSPRAYKAVLRASDAAGRSQPVVLTFTVVR